MWGRDHAQVLLIATLNDEVVRIWQMLPRDNDRLDHELAGWFSQRGGGWTGTAAELLTSVRARSNTVDSTLWPLSPRIFYAHLQSHRQILRSLGMDVLLRPGSPRMVSVRACRNDPPPSWMSDTTDIDRVQDPPITLSSVVEPQNTSPADSRDLAQTASHAVHSSDIPTAEPESRGRSEEGKFASTNALEPRIFENTGEALFAIVEMRRRVREQSLDLEAAVDLVIGPAQEITRSWGIAVGFLPRNRNGRSWRTGGYSSRNGQHFHANLFQSRLMAGEAVQVQDVQRHPLLGAACRREGIGSLIIVPIFRNQEVAGAMEFLFQEKRSFSSGDVMDLGLIAGIISESLMDATQVGAKQPEGPECPPDAERFKRVQPEPTRNEKADPAEALPIPITGSTNAKTLATESSTPEQVATGMIPPKLVMAPVLLWRTLKKAWVTIHDRCKLL